MEVASWLSLLECEMGFAFRVIHYCVLGRTFSVDSWLERSKEEPAPRVCRDKCDGYSLANRSPRTRIWLSLTLEKGEGHSKVREMQLKLQGSFICLVYLKLDMILAVHHSYQENSFCLWFELRRHYQKEGGQIAVLWRSLSDPWNDFDHPSPGLSPELHIC